MHVCGMPFSGSHLSPGERGAQTYNGDSLGQWMGWYTHIVNADVPRSAVSVGLGCWVNQVHSRVAVRVCACSFCAVHDQDVRYTHTAEHQWNMGSDQAERT